jgi:hypothetical protein
MVILPAALNIIMVYRPLSPIKQGYTKGVAGMTCLTGSVRALAVLLKRVFSPIPSDSAVPCHTSVLRKEHLPKAEPVCSSPREETNANKNISPHKNPLPTGADFFIDSIVGQWVTE